MKMLKLIICKLFGHKPVANFYTTVGGADLIVCDRCDSALELDPAGGVRIRKG